MRLDRTLSLYLARPLRKIGLGTAENGLPILMYHSISEDPETGVTAYFKTCTNPVAFERQMRGLHEQGYRAVSLDTATQYLRQPNEAGEKVVAITFDDGFRDFHTHAMPVLERLGFTATMYLPTAFIGDQRRCFKNRDCLTWGEISELHARGIQFGSHTVNHPVLYRLPWRDIGRETGEAKATLEDRLQIAVHSFAYPYAFPQENRMFVDRFKETLRSQGYKTCVTTVIARAKAGADPLELKRLPVNDCDDMALLNAKLRGDYDWLAVAQGWFRRAKARTSPASGTPTEPA